MAKDSSPGDLAALDLMEYFIKEAEASPNGLTEKQLKERQGLIQKCIDSHGDLSAGVRSALKACADEVNIELELLKK